MADTRLWKLPISDFRESRLVHLDVLRAYEKWLEDKMRADPNLLRPYFLRSAAETGGRGAVYHGFYPLVSNPDVNDPEDWRPASAYHQDIPAIQGLNFRKILDGEYPGPEDVKLVLVPPEHSIWYNVWSSSHRDVYNLPRTEWFESSTGLLDPIRAPATLVQKYRDMFGNHQPFEQPLNLI